MSESLSTQPMLRFRASVLLGLDLDETLTESQTRLKSLRPEIESIEVVAEPEHVGGTMGLGTKAKVTGMILFRPGSSPDLATVDIAGQASFDDFDPMPSFYMTGAAIICRECHKSIGKIRDYLVLMTSGNEVQFKEAIRQTVLAHIEQAHPDMESSGLVL